MKDMDRMSVEIADRIHSLIMERVELREKLGDCEARLCGALVDWAKEATGIHEGRDFLFKGKKAELYGYNVIGLPEDFAGAARCIGAMIQTDPGSFVGPRSFEHCDISVKDFAPLEVKADEKA